VLARLSALSRATASGAAVLPSLARVVGDGLGARSCEVRLVRPDGQAEISSWRAGTARPDPDILAVPVVHRGGAVGEIRVEPPAGGLAPDQRRLLAQLADGAGPVLHNAQLAAELRQRLAVISEQADRIAASRRRIAAAQAHERQVLERNLHDAAQPRLTAVSLALGLAAHRVSATADGGGDGSPDLPAVLERIVNRVDEAGASLSEIARGLYPARLREDGLRAALEAHASSLPGAIGLEFRDGTGAARFTAEVEAAVCFTCLEALQNAVKHAPGAPVRLVLARSGGALRFAVADAGPGIGPETAAGFGQQGMEDRMAAVGGSVEIWSRPGEGTVVSGWVPAQPVLPGEPGMSDEPVAHDEPVVHDEPVRQGVPA
jgi:signal transduction histidine kinase